ncbi:MAG: hypothetical protein QOH64_1306 [Acidimicrobiaceae bacterium]|jgi:uncharacterized protein (DUF2267 family)
MRRIVGIVTLGASVLVACSGGGGAAAPTTTTASASATTTTTTLAATTTTVAPEQAVRAAYLAYWAMVDRLAAAPAAEDAELAQRTVDPLLSFLRDEFTTSASTGLTVRLPPGPHPHRIDSVQVSSNAATVKDCYVDDRIQVDAQGNVVNNDVVTKELQATLVFSGEWRLSQLQQLTKTGGVSGCAV